MQDQEIKRVKQLQGNRKLPQYKPSEDPVLNDFRRENMFHRQAQDAVMNGILWLRKLGNSQRARINKSTCSLGKGGDCFADLGGVCTERGGCQDCRDRRVARAAVGIL